jgi:hypothetical protein
MFQKEKVIMAVFLSVAVHVVLLFLFFAISSKVEETKAITNEPSLTASFNPTGEAEFQKRVESLKTKLKGRGFTVLIQSPFVVIGDEPETVVKKRAENTVKWAVDKLKQDYFTKDPESILEIWLFKDDASYRKHAKEFLRRRTRHALRLVFTVR